MKQTKPAQAMELRSLSPVLCGRRAVERGVAMGLDVILGPAAGFLDWTPEEWQSYYDQADAESGVRLGGYTAVACSLETVRACLESGTLGSRFPLFMRLAMIHSSGWYLTELESLVGEVRRIRQALADCPLDRIVLVRHEREGSVTVGPATAAEVAELRREFTDQNPGVVLENLADFNEHLLSALEEISVQAKAQQLGLVLY